MRVAAQIEAEMAVILMSVFGLRLRAQNDLIDEYSPAPGLSRGRGSR